MNISVVVPTYRRPTDLRRCLNALGKQTRPADEVVVVVRDTDDATIAMLAGLDAEERNALALREARVTVPGQVQALNRGLAEVRGDVMAITDDDAEPHPDWLARIERHFAAREELAGVGGRDYLHEGGILKDGRAETVGRVPFGRHHIGNHHLGHGAARDVDVLKGVNGAYRVDAIRPIGFDTRLRGTGAQVHWEISLGLALRKRGWRLLYDPKVAVNHYLAPRHDEDQRNSFNRLALKNLAYNESLIRFETASPLGAAAFLTWATLVGSRITPGLVQVARFAPTERWMAPARAIAVLEGRAAAVKDMILGRTRRAF